MNLSESGRNLGLAITVAGSALIGSACRQESVSPQPTPISSPRSTALGNNPYDLLLDIPQKGWNEALAKGPKWGTVPFVADPKTECPPLTKDICMGNTDPDFQVMVNGPMFLYVTKVSGLENPQYPTKIFFANKWLPKVEGNDGDAAHNVYQDYDDTVKQEIVISMKAATLEAIKLMRASNVPFEKDFFDGTLSTVVSSAYAHEGAHAGREMKVIKQKGGSPFDNPLRNLLHPQINRFTEKYSNLARNATSRIAGLIVGVSSSGDIHSYAQQVVTEAEQLGVK